VVEKTCDRIVMNTRDNIEGWRRISSCKNPSTTKNAESPTKTKTTMQAYALHKIANLCDNDYVRLRSLFPETAIRRIEKNSLVLVLYFVDDALRHCVKKNCPWTVGNIFSLQNCLTTSKGLPTTL
jgi:hypothetical protein